MICPPLVPLLTPRGQGTGVNLHKQSKQTMAQRSAERSVIMIDKFAEYLRSQRTLTAAQVDARTAQRCRYDLSPAERLDNATHHAEYGSARH